jgi:hypothetical protein
VGARRDRILTPLAFVQPIWNEGGRGRSRSNLAPLVLVSFVHQRYRRATTDAERLTPASAADLADAIAFALRFRGRQRVHDAGEIMANIAAERSSRTLTTPASAS